MAYAYRKGLRTNATHYGATGYGEIWWVTDKTLAKCAPMNEHYKEFQRLRAKKKDCGFCLIPGKIGKSCKCRWELEQKMEKQERLGKDAKKQCDVQREIDEIEEEQAYIDSMTAPDPIYLQPDVIAATADMYQDTTYSPPADDVAWDDGATDEVAEANKKLMLYGGGAAAVLLLIVMMRRK